MNNRRKAGKPKPQSFDFLGVTHYCSTTMEGMFVVKRHRSKKRMRKELRSIKEMLLRNRHGPVPKQGLWVRQVVQGYFNYHAVRWNLRALFSFRREVCRYWLRSLRWRSLRDHMKWQIFGKLANLFVPKVKLVHHPPDTRFDARY